MNATSITTNKYDFKNAPEGTTHFNPETDGVAACWVKIDGNDVYFQYYSLAKQPWNFWFLCDDVHRRDTKSNFVEINPKAQLSFHVGDNCEAYCQGVEEWYAVEILAQHPNSKFVFACKHIFSNTLFWSDSFRPMKTQEEIEREEAVKEIYHDIHNRDDDYTKNLGQYLIDKGWRKK